MVEAKIEVPPVVGAMVDVASYNYDGRIVTFRTHVLNIVGFDIVNKWWVVNVPVNYEVIDGDQLQAQYRNSPKNQHVAVQRTGNGWQLAFPPRYVPAEEAHNPAPRS